MIDKGVVLRAVKHLEHRGCGIAAHIIRELVDLVKEQQRIHGLCLPHGLDDAAWPRADIGAAVAADLGLVVYAAETHADKSASHGLRDRLCDRGLADARRADETENLSLRVARQLLYGEHFDDAFLDLLHAVMVAVKNAPCVLQVKVVLRALRPWQLKQALDIRLRHGLLMRSARQGVKAVDLLFQLFLHIVRQRQLLHAAAIVCRFGRFADAELFLHGLELLAQDEFSLVAIRRFFDFGRDTVVDFHDLQLVLDDLEHTHRTRLRVRRFHKLLLVEDLRGALLPNGVHKCRKFGNAQDRVPLIGCQAIFFLCKCQEPLGQAAAQRLLRNGVRLCLREIGDLRFKVRLDRSKLLDMRAGNARNKQMHGVISNAEHLSEATDRTETVQLGLVDLGAFLVFLHTEQSKPVRREGLLHRKESFLPANIAMHDLAGQNGQSAQRDNGQFGFRLIQCFHM